MKSRSLTVKLAGALLMLSSTAALAGGAGLAVGGQMVVGRGKGPSAVGAGVSDYCVDQAVVDRSTRLAEKEANQNAANQCQSGIANKAGDYVLNSRCTIWNSFFPGTLAQAAYICAYQ